MKATKGIVGHRGANQLERAMRSARRFRRRANARERAQDAPREAKA